MADDAPSIVHAIRLSWVANATGGKRGLSMLEDPAAEALHHLVVVQLGIRAASGAGTVVPSHGALVCVDGEQIDPICRERVGHDIHDMLQHRSDAFARPLRAAYAVEGLGLGQRGLSGHQRLPVASIERPEGIVGPLASAQGRKPLVRPVVVAGSLVQLIVAWHGGGGPAPADIHVLPPRPARGPPRTNRPIVRAAVTPDCDECTATGTAVGPPIGPYGAPLAWFGSACAKPRYAVEGLRAVWVRPEG